METLVQFIQLLSLLLTLTVLADILVSFFLSPYHQVRRALDSLVDPFLRPIRRFLPPVGGFDFSPVVLLVVIRLLENLLTGVLRGLA